MIGANPRVALMLACALAVVSLLAPAAVSASTMNAVSDEALVTVQGSWTWPAKADCERSWVGWAVDWGDPSEPGHSVGGRQVGTPGDRAVHTTSDCGEVASGGGRRGAIGALSHRYSRSGDYTVCLVMYDIALKAPGQVKAASELVAGGPGHNVKNSEESPAQAPQAPACQSITVTIPRPASLEVLKTVEPAAAAPGDTLTWTITITNVGDLTANGVSASDDLSAALQRGTFISASSGGVLSGSTVSWTDLTVYGGSSTTLSIRTRLNAGGWPAGTTTISNTVVVPGSGCAAGSSDASCRASATVTPVAKLAARTSVSRSSAAPGETLTYTVAIENSGTAAASNLTVTDDLAGVLAHGSLLSASGGGALAGTTLRWASVDVAAGSTTTLTYAVRLDVDGWPAGATTVANRIVVPGTACTAGGADAACSASTTVTPTFALTATNGAATARGGPFGDRVDVRAGDTVWYSVRVTNSGNATLTSVTVSDTAGLPGGQCAAVPSTLAPGASYACLYSRTATLGTITSTVTADSTETAPVRASVVTAAAAAAAPAIGISASASPSTLPAGGGFVNYDFTVRNAGNVPLTSVSVADDTCGPVNLASGDGNSNGRLDTGETWRFTCTARLASTTTNTATASGTFETQRVSATDRLTVNVLPSPTPGTALATPRPSPASTATPGPSPTATATSTPTAQPSVTPGPTPAPTPTPTSSAFASPSPSPAVTTPPTSSPSPIGAGTSPTPPVVAPTPTQAVLAAAGQGGQSAAPIDPATTISRTGAPSLGSWLPFILVLLGAIAASVAVVAWSKRTSYG